MGDFSSWQCFTGRTYTDSNKNKITLNPSSAIPGRHEIIKAGTLPKNDPYGNFPVFCPYGGGNSVKLGNTGVGAEAEGLSYTFVVPASIDTFTFTFFYAVVFENPGHAIAEQPRFFVTAYDVLTGDLINCASYDYVSTGALPGFEVSPVNSGVLFKNWSPTSLQFAGLGGRTVRLEFKSADCTLGGHFGYAYVDVGSGCSNILATAPYCRETNSLILNAPYGFNTYTWYNHDYSAVVGNQQPITLRPPPATSGIFNVDVVPYAGYGCRDTFQAKVTPLPVPDTPAAADVVLCQFAFATALKATALPGNDLVWYGTDSTNAPGNRAPIPSTLVQGTFNYYVSQKVLFGCESFRKKITVTVVPTPKSSFTVNTKRQCENGNIFVFTSTATNLFNPVYYWDFGDGTNQSSPTDSVVTHSYNRNGNFNVKLRVVNNGVCFSEVITNVVVVPKPTASFNFPPVICQNQTTIQTTDKSSVPGNVATINRWWWNFDGSILQTQNPNTFIASQPGNLVVQLVVTTTEGCYSDTAKAIMPVHPQPVAAFTFSAPMCDNETIRLSDLSTVSQNFGQESVVKWNWQIANSATNLQNPSINLMAGVNTAKLISETTFGCKSTEVVNTFTVHPKPQIQLSISDSCVFRTINYNALDISNTVDKWFWNFGSGLKKDDAVIRKQFAVEGFNPLTVVGQTIVGCKDTIVRPFTIYDNKAVVGRDTIAAIDEPVQLNANGGSNNTYKWSPAIGLNNPLIEKPVATLDQDQLYKMDAITKEGCDAHDQILIRRFKGPELYIANAFTPNADGKNDLLKVFPVGIIKFHYLAVYNRNGELIFKTTDYNQGWNGVYKGMPLATQTFVVIAEATDYHGKRLFKKGTVTLFR
ncbi:MAG: PKD domain-containing protein [Bacteroidota bacterium]